jgi:hypothetical protein
VSPGADGEGGRCRKQRGSLQAAACDWDAAQVADHAADQLQRRRVVAAQWYADR